MGLHALIIIVRNIMQTIKNTVVMPVLDNCDTTIKGHDELLDGAVLVGFELTGWGGKKTFTEGKVYAQDATGEEVEFPSELVTKGQKALLDTKNLNFVSRYRARLKSAYMNYGVKVFGGYLVTEENYKSLSVEAECIVGDYNMEVSDFSKRYQSLISDWCAEYPEYAAAIRNGILTDDEVKAKFKVKLFEPIKFTPTSEDSKARIMNQVSEQLFEDIASVANSFYRESLDGKSVVTQKAKRPLSRLRDKIYSLINVDPIWDCVYDIFSKLLDSSLPKNGKIDGEPLRELISLVSLMRCPISFKEYVERLQDANVIAQQSQTSASSQSATASSGQSFDAANVDAQAQADADTQVQNEVQVQAQAKVKANAQAAAQADASVAANAKVKVDKNIQSEPTGNKSGKKANTVKDFADAFTAAQPKPQTVSQPSTGGFFNF